MAYSPQQLEKLRITLVESDWNFNGTIEWSEKDRAINFIASALSDNSTTLKTVTNALFDEMADKNGDGKISVDEIVAFFAKQP